MCGEDRDLVRSENCFIGETRSAWLVQSLLTRSPAVKELIIVPNNIGFICVRYEDLVLCRSVKRSNVAGNPFEWLLGENKVE